MLAIVLCILRILYRVAILDSASIMETMYIKHIIILRMIQTIVIIVVLQVIGEKKQEALDLFRETKKLGLTALMDSNGSLDFSRYPELLAASDGVMLDVKAVRPQWHQELVSYPAEPVLRNLEYLLSAGKLQEVRTIIFPGRDRENEESVRTVAARIGDACDYKIIRYRPYGVRERYQQILGTETTDAAYAESYAALARSLGAARAYVI